MYVLQCWVGGKFITVYGFGFQSYLFPIRLPPSSSAPRGQKTGSGVGLSSSLPLLLGAGRKGVEIETVFVFRDHCEEIEIAGDLY